MAVLRRDGPSQLTMRAIAAEAGVTATALYRHFASREELLRAVIREAYRIFRTYLVVEHREGGPAAWLRLGFDRYLRFALEHRNYYLLLFAEPHGLGIDRYPDDFLSGRSPAFRQLRDVVQANIDAGVLRPTEAADLALTLYAHMHGLVMLHFAGRFQSDRVFERFFHASLERVLRGAM